MLKDFVPCKVPGCINLTSMISIRLCVNHMLEQIYANQWSRAKAIDPAKAHKAISLCLAQFVILRDGGLLSLAAYNYLSEIFMLLSKPLVDLRDYDHEAIAMAEAMEQYAKRHDVIQAESEEEARKIQAESEEKERKIFAERLAQHEAAKQKQLTGGEPEKAA